MVKSESELSNQHGFTLLEMMVVVAIIAILAGILIPNFAHARASAQTAACIGNMKTIATALELFYTDKQYYPTAGTAVMDNVFMSNSGMNSYLAQIPEDPAGGPNAYYVLTTTNSAQSGGTSGYTIWCPGSHDPATLQNLSPGTTDTHIKYTNSTGFGTATQQGS